MSLDVFLNPAVFAAMIDHTFLKPFGPPADIEQLCEEAAQYRFAMVAVNPGEVERCAALLNGTDVRVGAAIGFPLGQNTAEAKKFETADAIENGATEIDTVINLRALKAGNTDLVYREIATMAELCKPHGAISKAILETCYLTEEEKVTVCELAVKAGVDFVKTSTGFGTAGATVADVKLMRSVCGPKMGVKAAGGIRTLEIALAMIEAGATRLGTSCGVKLMESLAAGAGR
jgi:deoxyribose-phosphate aldolase